MPTIKQDLEKILKMMPSFIDIMLNQTQELANLSKRGMIKKRITAKNIMTLIQFSQNMVQGGWKNKDAFYQIPFLEDATLKKFR